MVNLTYSNAVQARAARRKNMYPIRNVTDQIMQLFHSESGLMISIPTTVNSHTTRRIVIIL